MRSYNVYRYEDAGKEIICPTGESWLLKPSYKKVVRIEMNNRDKTYDIICQSDDYRELFIDEFPSVQDINNNKMILNRRYISMAEPMKLVTLKYATHHGNEKVQFLIAECMEVKLEEDVAVLKVDPYCCQL